MIHKHTIWENISLTTLKFFASMPMEKIYHNDLLTQIILSYLFKSKQL